MKTLVGTPDPPEQPRVPEVVYCVTTLGTSEANSLTFTVPAVINTSMNWVTC